MKEISRAGRLIPAIFFLFLFSFFSIAYDSYPQPGGVNGTYYTGKTFLLDAIDSTTVEDIDGYSVIVDDFAGNGDNQIVMMDLSPSNPALSNLYLFNYTLNDLIPVDVVQLNNSGQDYFVTNLASIDIDDDGRKEIIYVSGATLGGLSDYIHSYEVINNNLIHTGYQMTGGANTCGFDYCYITCEEEWDVCAVFTERSIAGGDVGYVDFFNSTFDNAGSNVIYSGYGNQGACSPRHEGVIKLGNFDPTNGNRIEAVVSYISPHATPRLCFGMMSANPTNTSFGDYTLEVNACDSSFGGISDASPSCSNYEYRVTPPLVTNFDGLTGNGDEIIVAGMREDDNSYFAVAFHVDGTTLDTYPNKVLAGDVTALYPTGQFFNNIVLTNTMSSSGLKDACVIPFNPDSSEQPESMCFSKQSTTTGFWGLTFDNIFFDYPNYETNISPTLLYHPHKTFTTQHIDGVSTATEIMTHDGIYEIDRTNEEWDLIYSYPISDIDYIPVDFEQQGWDDIIGFDDDTGTLYYFDDNFQNSDCETYGCIENIETNPCIDFTLKQNTSLNIYVTANDFDEDDIAYRVIYYAGETWAYDDGWSSNRTSGTPYSITKQVGNITSDGIVSVRVMDVENWGEYQEINLSLSVASNGEEFGDSSCVKSYETSGYGATDDDDVTTPTTTQSAEQNILEGSMTDLQTMSGLSTIALWYLILLCILIFMGFDALKNPDHILGAITLSVIISFSWIMLGYYIGFIPFGHLLVIVMILLISAGIYFVNLLGLGKTNSGG